MGGMGAMPTEAIKSPGEWVSPLTSELIVSQNIKLGATTVGQDGHLYWLEGRPSEKGRQVLVRRPRSGGAPADVTPALDSGLNVRTRVQEYGGGDYVLGSSTVYFSNFSDQRLYKQALGAEGAAAPATPLTAEGSSQRFADAVLDEARGRLVCVCEDHSAPGEAVTTINAVDQASGAVTTLVKGSDFYAAPRLSPDGSKLAWVCWQHPNMPWDDTELWMADVTADGTLENLKKVAGGEGESVMQPLFSSTGQLHFITDAPSGWWNIYRLEEGGELAAVCPMEAEVGGPAWQFGNTPYQVLGDGRVLAVYSDPKRAGVQLGLLCPRTRSVSDVPTPCTLFGAPTVVEEASGALTIFATAGSALQPTVAVVLTAPSADALLTCQPSDWEVVAQSSSGQVDPGYLSEPRAVEFPTTSGLSAYFNYYPPKNKDYAMPEGAKPPLLVKIHGGPTAQAGTSFNPAIQYWTSRGFAVADVNYGGSTGYGRAYRKRLAGTWGIVDVDDCSNAAKHLAAEGLADPERLCIDGGSAGGFTALACLAFRDVFAAGASHYGVADLELLAKETHKFESRYLDGLVGPYPQAAETYKARSPINALDNFSKPTAFFQGTEDQIVPASQAELMHAALKARGVPTALVMFEGEQHGFRQAPNIRRALDGELYFYGQALGFKPAMPADFEPIEIDNM